MNSKRSLLSKSRNYYIIGSQSDVPPVFLWNMGVLWPTKRGNISNFIPLDENRIFKQNTFLKSSSRLEWSGRPNQSISIWFIHTGTTRTHTHEWVTSLDAVCFFAVNELRKSTRSDWPVHTVRYRYIVSISLESDSIHSFDWFDSFFFRTNGRTSYLCSVHILLYSTGLTLTLSMYHHIPLPGSPCENPVDEPTQPVIVYYRYIYVKMPM